MAEDQKCCKKFKLTVVGLLVLNTLLLASIFCAMKCKSGICPLSSNKGKICPISGKQLGVDKTMEKGS